MTRSELKKDEAAEADQRERGTEALEEAGRLHVQELLPESGRSLGTVTGVIPNPANDLWVAVDDDGIETLVPAIRDVVVVVDVVGKRILVRDMPGLTAPDTPDRPGSRGHH